VTNVGRYGVCRARARGAFRHFALKLGVYYSPRDKTLHDYNSTEKSTIQEKTQWTCSSKNIKHQIGMYYRTQKKLFKCICF